MQRFADRVDTAHGNERDDRVDPIRGRNLTAELLSQWRLAARTREQRRDGEWRLGSLEWSTSIQREQATRWRCGTLREEVRVIAADERRQMFDELRDELGSALRTLLGWQAVECTLALSTQVPRERYMRIRIIERVDDVLQLDVVECARQLLGNEVFVHTFAEGFSLHLTPT
jgi:hypothetical protein